MPLNLLINNSINDQNPGTLYVTATPIGNMEDITLRALRILNQVDLIAAEDTRHTKKLLSYHHIKTPLISCHDYNEEKRSPALIQKLRQGMSIALVSDAGTPSISDPGFRLINQTVNSGLPVIPIPGVSAAVAAISASGLPMDSFLFTGFVSRKKNKRQKQLKDLAKEPRTLIFYESPKRILVLIQDIICVMEDRYAVLARELTKIHEEFLRDSLSNISEILKKRSKIKGECTLMVSGASRKEDISLDIFENEIKDALNSPDSSLSQVVKKIAKQYDLPRKKVYLKALEIKES
ncbi:16S rRNA 2'-O-ribose C1402 methyltransferase [Candidatus Magnetomoraceae bacterium gMMP-15]